MFVKTDIEDFDVSSPGIYMVEYAFMVTIKGIRYECKDIAAQRIAVAYGKPNEKPTVKLIIVPPVSGGVAGDKIDMINAIVTLALRVVNILAEKNEIEPTLKYDEIKKVTLELLHAACVQYDEVIQTEDQYLQGLAMGKIVSVTQLAEATNTLTKQEIAAIKKIYGV